MRRSRIIVEGAWYHIIARINRGECIFNNDAIKELFLNTVIKAKTNSKHRFRFQIANFCIMGNHIHLLLRPEKGESLSRIMQWILSVFAINYNKYTNTRGHVWYDRFKSILVQSIRQFLAVFNYIVYNPQKAGLCIQPSDYRYGGQYFIKNNDFHIIDAVYYI